MGNEIIFSVYFISMLALPVCIARLVHYEFEDEISKKYNSFLNWIFGKKQSAEADSNFRRLLTIYVACASYGIIVTGIGELNFETPENNEQSYFLTAVTCLIPIGYFIYVVLLTPFRESDKFTVNPLRLAHNSMISALGTICFFSMFYSTYGIKMDGNCDTSVTIFDSMYFSAVTFSTLGYGDLAPCNGMGRFMASFEALIGNTHLGVFVAAIFLSVRQKP